MDAIVAGKTEVESGVIFKSKVKYYINAVNSQTFTIPSGSNAFCLYFVEQTGRYYYEQKEIGMFVSFDEDDYKISNVYRQFIEANDDDYDPEGGVVTLYVIEVYYKASGKIELHSNATLNRMIQSFEIGTLK